jgi:putative transposase
MKRSRFLEGQIIGILKEHEAGVSVADLCRKQGVSDASIYKWKAAGRRHAGQCGAEGPVGKEMVTPAGRRSPICETRSG